MPLYLPLSSYAARNGALLSVAPIVHYPPVSPTTVLPYSIAPPGAGPPAFSPPAATYGQWRTQRGLNRQFTGGIGPVAL